ncbi:CPBP family intramembrane metalloprotease [Ectothiorhodospiraceae bacterium 2226]|nr:CPBP family intramembrane metalloprotease [Ectothiorhodospiraceae bacterium 2226]
MSGVSALLLTLTAASIAAAWLPARVRLPAAGALVLATLAVALAFGALAPVGLLWLTLLFASAWWAAHGARLRAAGWVGFVLLGLALGFGLLPGFFPVALSEAAVLKPESAPFALRLRLDKALIAVPLLLWLVPLARDAAAWRRVAGVALPVGGVTLAVVGAAALAVDYVAWMPGLPPWPLTLAWMVMNLLVVCAVEEGFFRGLLQRGLVRVLPGAVAIGVAALAFGLAHVGGGWWYVGLATAAGVGYGLTYQLAGERLEAAMLVHFGLNLAHLALFTYPYAQAG